MYGRVLVLSQMDLIAGWAGLWRAVIGRVWKFSGGARARGLCVGPISTEWPHYCVAGPNLDAARG